MGVNLLENTWMTDKFGKSKRRIDLFSALDSVSWVWQAVGGFPMLFVGSSNMKKCCFSKILIAYDLVLFFTSVGFIATAICTWTNILRKNSWVMVMTAVVRTTSWLLCMLINSIMWILYRKDFVDAVDFLASQNVILNQLGCRLDYVRRLRIIKSLVYGMLAIMSILITWAFISSTLRWVSEYTVYVFLQWLFWNVPSMAQVMIPTIFGSFVIILGFHFRELNIKMMAVRDRNNSLSPKVIEITNECAESIRLIAKIHYNLCKIAKFINKLFSPVLVVMVVTAFFIMSSSLYFIFSEVVKDEETDYWAISTYISWEIDTTLPIVITVIICNLTSNEAALTGKLIHELYVESSESKVYQIIRSLSLQLHHQKIEFSGAGLFPINSSLLQAMIGNMTTSLVILIQFQPSLEPIS